MVGSAAAVAELVPVRDGARRFARGDAEAARGSSHRDAARRSRSAACRRRWRARRAARGPRRRGCGSTVVSAVPDPERPRGHAEVLHRGIHAGVEAADVHRALVVRRRPRDDRLEEEDDRRHLADMVGEMTAGVARAAPRSRGCLVAERRRIGQRPLVSVERLAVQRATSDLRAGSVTTTYCCGCTLPPLGACWAARRQTPMSSSVTGRR